MTGKNITEAQDSTMVSDKEEADKKTPCFHKKIGGMTYHVEVHFSKDSRQSVEDKLKRVIYLAA